MVLLKTGNSDLHLSAIKWYAANTQFHKNHSVSYCDVHDCIKGWVDGYTILVESANKISKKEECFRNLKENCDIITMRVVMTLRIL
jgi:hypothetical protein